LISKVYFPRLIVPTATVIVAFVDFLITFAMLALLMAWYRFLPGCGCWSCQGSLC
jgi:lipopolysaccharide transport system permease protein